MSHRRRRLASTLTTLAVILLPGVAEAAPGKLRWTPCHADVGPRFECAVAQVPLDYDRPRGATISLALTRLPADRSGAPDRLAVPEPRRARAGRASTSCSAPGRSCTPTRSGRASTSSASTRAASSAARRCVASTAWSSGRRFPPFAFPLTRDQEQQWIADGPRARPRLRRARRADPRPHVDRQRGARHGRAARPRRRRQAQLRRRLLRLLSRRHVREPVPRPVRALVVDGVLDPIAWSTGRGRRGAARPVLDTPAQRRGRAGDAE